MGVPQQLLMAEQQLLLLMVLLLMPHNRTLAPVRTPGRRSGPWALSFPQSHHTLLVAAAVAPKAAREHGASGEGTICWPRRRLESAWENSPLMLIVELLVLLMRMVVCWSCCCWCCCCGFQIAPSLLKLASIAEAVGMDPTGLWTEFATKSTEGCCGPKATTLKKDEDWRGMWVA